MTVKIKKGVEVVAGRRFVGIDVSTKTGLVVLDESGKVFSAKELVLEEIPKGSHPGLRIARALKLSDHVFDTVMLGVRLVAVEGYAHASKFNNYVQTELGAAVRFAIYKPKVPFVEVSPSTLKKFATGVGKGDKSNVRLGVYKKWGFEHPSDNVVDAYVLARIALAYCGHAKLLDYEREIVGALRKSA